jgi:hypothetical protein
MKHEKLNLAPVINHLYSIKNDTINQYQKLMGDEEKVLIEKVSQLFIQNVIMLQSRYLDNLKSEEKKSNYSAIINLLFTK